MQIFKPECKVNINTMEEVVYTSKSELKHPLKLIRNMFSDLLSCRDLTMSLLMRDINAKYRQSILGYLWACLPSLVTALTFTPGKQVKDNNF